MKAWLRTAALLALAALTGGCVAWGPPLRMQVRDTFVADALERDATDLRSADPTIRYWALIRLMQRVDRRAIPLIRPLVRREREDVPIIRAAAVQTLRRLGDTDSLAELALISDDPDPFVRREILKTFGTRPTDLGVSCLLYALRCDPEEDVRIEAADCLAQVGGRAAIPRLIAALDDRKERSASVRLAAWQALVHLTQTDHGMRPSRWEKWWKEQEATP